MGIFNRKPKGKEPAKARPVFASAERYKQQRQQIVLSRKQSVRGEWWRKNRSWVLALIALVTFIVISGVFLITLRSAPQFKLNNIVIRGNLVAKTEQVQDALAWTRDQSLYALSTAAVERDLLQKFPYFHRAQVRKVLPSSLLIEIEERSPVLTYVNLSSAISVDIDGKVIAVFESTNAVPLSKERMDVLQGYGDVESLSVQEKFFSKIEDERERLRTQWNEVPLDKKQAALAELRQDYQRELDETLLARVAKLDPSLSETLPLLQDLTNQQFKQGEDFPRTKFRFGYDLLNYFTQSNLSFLKLVWITDFNIVATLTSGTQIIFTTTRSLQDQLTALETMRRVEDITRARVVDVRANVVSVK